LPSTWLRLNDHPVGLHCVIRTCIIGGVSLYEISPVGLTENAPDSATPPMPFIDIQPFWHYLPAR
jgi:hypothetical protein